MNKEEFVEALKKLNIKQFQDKSNIGIIEKK